MSRRMLCDIKAEPHSTGPEGDGFLHKGGGVMVGSNLRSGSSKVLNLGAIRMSSLRLKGWQERGRGKRMQRSRCRFIQKGGSQWAQRTVRKERKKEG